MSAREGQGQIRDVEQGTDAAPAQLAQVSPPSTRVAAVHACRRRARPCITPCVAPRCARVPQVDFRVDFVQKGTLNLMVLKETSTFRKDAEGRWLYAKGDVEYEAQSVTLTEEEQQQLQQKLAEHNERVGG